MGCPSGLDDPDRFLGDGGAVNNPDTGVQDGGMAACDPVTDIFPASCAAQVCHSSSAMLASLDLESPGVFSRVSQANAQSSCPGDPIVDMNNPTESVLYKKVTGTQCGGIMPPSGGQLNQSQIDCIEQWIMNGSGG